MADKCDNEDWTVRPKPVDKNGTKALPELDERALRIKELELKLQRQRDAFVFLAQDVKFPLAALVGMSEFLLEHSDVLPYELFEALSDAARAANEATLRVNDLLAIAEGDERGELELRPRLSQLWAIIDDAAAHFRFEARERSISLAMDVPTRLWVDVDPVLIGRALRNLIGSALQFTERSGSVDVRVVERPSEVVLTVRHTGTPIPPALRAHVFEKFAPRPVDADGARRGGVGLCFCRHVFEAHQGTVDLVDVEGWAVAFEARLPLGAHATESNDDEETPGASGMHPIDADERKRSRP